MNNIYSFVKQVSLAVAVVLTVGFMTSCSQNDEVSVNPAQNVLKFKVSDANAVTRAATDAATMVTTFEAGDQAGLYIVKNGAVLYENVVLTYNDLDVWVAETPIPVSDEVTGARFYVYYPYSEETTFDVSAEEPLKAYVDGLAPVADQSTQEAFEQADVMMGSTNTIGDKNTVTLQLAHQKSLVYVELPNKSYVFDNEGMEPYIVDKATDVSFTLNGTTVTPYVDAASQSYRLIVNPGQAGTFRVDYKNNGTAAYYEVNELSQIRGGQYAKYVVDGGAVLTNYGTLQVGDFYCADGKLVSKDTPAADLPSNVVGVIFKIGTTEAIANANSNWSHAVVVGLEDSPYSKWGNDQASAATTDAWKNWFTQYGLQAQNSNSAASLNEELMAEEGYQVTALWRKVPEPLEIGGKTLDYTSGMNAAYNNWVAKYPISTVTTTGWYLPSLKDWQNLDAAKSAVDQQMNVLGKDELMAFRKNSSYASKYYWSCNIRSVGIIWSYVMGQSALGDRYKTPKTSDSNFYRYLFAF